MPRKVRATPPSAARRPRPAAVTVVAGHPLAVRAARRLARPGQRLVAQPDGSVLVVNSTR